MDIHLHKITVGQLAEGYEDNAEGGVRGYGGRLDIRPAYQREFIYNARQRDAVIDTVTHGFPLNVMYWAVRDDGSYEVIDGQQRSISLCQYVTGVFSHDGRYFHNLQRDEQAVILGYPLMVYVCRGSDSERLQWFKTINIAGERLTEQELRNAVYAGPWLSDAKRYFSKSGCATRGISDGYVSGSPIRQELLETALRWAADADGTGSIEEYMARHQHDHNALALWQYFQSVITWVQGTFVTKREKFMRSVDWGSLYNRHHAEVHDTARLEAETARLIMDDDVTRKAGIYPYLLTGDERHLSIRTFTPAMRQAAYERQGGICPMCGGHFALDGMQADHITPWSKGGRTTADNCQMLCADCNRRKSDT